MHVLNDMAQEDLVVLREAIDRLLALEKLGYQFDKEHFLKSLGIYDEEWDLIYTELCFSTDN